MTEKYTELWVDPSNERPRSRLPKQACFLFPSHLPRSRNLAASSTIFRAACCWRAGSIRCSTTKRLASSEHRRHGTCRWTTPTTTITSYNEAKNGATLLLCEE